MLIDVSIRWKKAMTPPNGFSEIIEFYGDTKFTGAPDAQVDPHWEAVNMMLLAGIPGIPKLYVHHKIAQPLIRAMTKATANGWAPRTAGCFAPRCQRGSSTRISIHTWGAAVDLDADDNPIITNCPTDDVRRTEWAERTNRIPDAVIAAFMDEGWTWGGDWSNRFDPMHFQWCSGY
jgi:hypothetical protein